MKFYRELSRVYDIVFPKEEKTLKFLMDSLKGNSKVLDLACGTGIYSLALALKGHRVDAIDLGHEMISLAKTKGGLYANFVVGDMTRFNEEYGGERYDLAYCIGNSIVHLKNKQKIQEFIQNIYRALNEEGKLVVQIVNYNRIINKDIRSLPTIDRADKGVKFIRNYEYKEQEEKVAFNTELIVSRNGSEESFENSVDLVAIRSNELEEMFNKAGFKNIEVYGSFSGEEFNEDSFALVMRGTKI